MVREWSAGLVLLGIGVLGLAGRASAQAATPGGRQGRPTVGVNLLNMGSESSSTANSGREIQGWVRDGAGKGVPGALVYLKDLGHKTTRSMQADDKGAFRFGQVPQGADFELWTQVKDRKGAVKSISSMDSSQHVALTLKAPEDAAGAGAAAH